MNLQSILFEHVDCFNVVIYHKIIALLYYLCCSKSIYVSIIPSHPCELESTSHLREQRPKEIRSRRKAT